jgi:glycosyltransferase involved in cell wall biosynthesis
MKEYIFLTNIPTPYRNSFYNELAKSNFNFKVYYMRSTEGDRSWNINISEIKHKFYIDNGFYKMFGRFHLHLNPKLIFKILLEKNVELIIGGGWNDPDVLFLILLKRLGLYKNQIHFWTEANFLTLGASKDNYLKKITRRFVYNSTTGAQLSSGKMTELTLEKWGVKVNKFVPLPNTIEEEKFLISSTDCINRLKNTIPLVILPVRIHEQVKGIINFFKSIGFQNIKKAKFLIAGDGPDRELVQKFMLEHSLEEHIILLGHCNTNQLVALYKQANFFVLPSFTDASPLTVIEALRMRLPLLISERCGNHFEAVIKGINGYIFDPYSPTTIKNAFELMINKNKDWKEMGEVSNKIYEQKFNKKIVINTFVKVLTGHSVVK